MGFHYVPRKYLEGFATPDDPKMIWQFDKQTMQFSHMPVSIKRVAQEREYYSQEVERQLADCIERPANAILGRLREGESLLNLSDQDRAELSVYMATMIYRVPRHRERAQETMPKALSSVVSRVKEQLQMAAAVVDLPEEVLSERLSARLAEADEIHERLSANPPPEILEQIRTPWPNEGVVDLIYSHNWYLVGADGRTTFITGDNPAFMFECYGLRNPDSEITFPVSTELALFGTRRPVKRQHAPVKSQRLVREANKRIVSSAIRFVYCSSRQDWIKKVAGNPKPYLSRIM